MAASNPSVQTDLRPEVLVVGAGLAGLSVAWWLRGRARVRVVDMASQAGAEASSQNAGMLRRLGEDPYERTLAQRVHTLLSAPQAATFGDPMLSRQTGAVLALAHDPFHLHDAVSGLRARGIRLEALDRTRLAEVAPAMADAPVVRAWFVPDERVVDAGLLVSALMRDLRNTPGCSVTLDTRIDALDVHAGKVRGVRTSDATLAADRVVLAGGAWSRHLVEPHGVFRPLIPLRRTLVQVRGPRLGAHHPWCWIDDVGVYVRPEGEGWLISGCDEAIDAPSQLASGSRGPVGETERALALDKVVRWFPALADVRAVGGWTGLRTFAPDRRPVLGADPELRGLWWCAGLGGFGVTCGLAAGEA
ncbi:MAG TPA: hypothetical protein DFR83_25990, partial [Deltaproteobacteria bacterium]|nr:hypothetical protein [Deltaproteobacteria bacterium]